MSKPKPTLLLGMINDAGLAKIVAECLAYHNFEVIDFSLDSLDFRYPGLRPRLSVLWQKLLGNKEAKKELMIRLKQKELSVQLAQNSRFDYALFIRSDIYPAGFLQKIKADSGMMVNYQWDGIGRFPAAVGHIPLFDRYYVFDPDDLGKNPALLPATSFYFDHFPVGEPDEPDTVYFVGAHRSDRIEAVNRFCLYAERNGIKLDFQIAYDNNYEAEKDYAANNIRFHNGISYRRHLENTRRCGILADFVISTHKGLSLRVFEAVGYHKKLITTNSEVAKYDFYHPDNIFIWNGKTFDGLDGFLARPYCRIDEAVRRKYSFGNWIRYILQIEPHQPVLLPEK